MHMNKLHLTLTKATNKMNNLLLLLVMFSEGSKAINSLPHEKNLPLRDTLSRYLIFCPALVRALRPFFRKGFLWLAKRKCV